MTTLNQMRYYRSKSVLSKIAKHLKLTNAQAHDWMKANVFGKSTTEFTDEDFDETMKLTRSKFSKLGVWIPEPGEDDNPPPNTDDQTEYIQSIRKMKEIYSIPEILAKRIVPIKRTQLMKLLKYGELHKLGTLPEGLNYILGAKAGFGKLRASWLIQRQELENWIERAKK